MNGMSPFYYDTFIMGDHTSEPDMDKVIKILHVLICSSSTKFMIEA